MSHATSATTNTPARADLGAPPSYGAILRFAGPLMLGHLTIALHFVADAYFIAQLGTAQLAAQPLAVMTYLVVALPLIGVARNALTFLSRAYGAGDHARLGVLVGHYQVLCLLGAPLVLATVLLFGPVGAMAGLTPAVAAHGHTYLAVRVWDGVFLLLFVLYSALYQAIGRAVFPMVVAWSGLALNVTLTYGLVFGAWGLPTLGIVGAAWATVASQALEAVVLGLACHFGPFRQRFGLRLWVPIQPRLMGNILRIGLPQGLGDLLDLLTFLVFFLMVGRLGMVELAVSNIASHVSHLLFIPGFAMGIAAASYMGRYLGALQPEHARVAAYRTLVVGMAYMGLLGLPLFVWGEAVTGLFSQEPAVIALGTKVFKVVAFLQVFDAASIILRGALNGAGDTRFTSLVLALMIPLGMVPAVWLLSKLVTPPVAGAWMGVFVYLVAVAGVMFTRFRRGSWRHIRLG